MVCLTQSEGSVLHMRLWKEQQLWPPAGFDHYPGALAVHYGQHRHPMSWNAPSVRQQVELVQTLQKYLELFLVQSHMHISECCCFCALHCYSGLMEFSREPAVVLLVLLMPVCGVCDRLHQG